MIWWPCKQPPVNKDAIIRILSPRPDLNRPGPNAGFPPVSVCADVHCLRSPVNPAPVLSANPDLLQTSAAPAYPEYISCLWPNPVCFELAPRHKNGFSVWPDED